MQSHIYDIRLAFKRKKNKNKNIESYVLYTALNKKTESRQWNI